MEEDRLNSEGSNSDCTENSPKRLCRGAEPSDWSRSGMRYQILHCLSEPVVLRGGCRHWPCVRWGEGDWTRLFEGQVLPLRVGLAVPQGMSLERPQWERESLKGEMTYPHLLEWVAGQRSCVTRCNTEVRSSTHWAYFDYFYMKDLVNIGQMGDIMDWGTFGFPERGVGESTMWVGSQGANTPCHIDTYGCNLVAQVVGRKRWVLFPKSQSALMLPSRVPYEESSIYSSVGFPRPSLKVHPQLAAATPRLVTLEAGDVLLVPQQWWHSVENLEFSVSINTWLELPSDHKERVKEALVMYQVGSLCQGVHSLDTIRAVFNPNMTDVAAMTPTQLLDLLLLRVVGPTLLEGDTTAHSSQDSGRSSPSKEVTGVTPPVVESGETKKRASGASENNSVLSVEKVPCVGFMEYLEMLYGPGGERGTMSIATSSSSDVDSASEDVTLNKIKLLIDAFTDQRVIDLIKKVIDEKRRLSTS